MAVITLRLCDRCDVRDRIDDGSVPHYKILPVRIRIEVDGDPDVFKVRDSDLCSTCRSDLHGLVVEAINQIPRQA